MFVVLFVFFFKQKTAYEMRISDWSSDVCSSDLTHYKQSECHIIVSKVAKSMRSFAGPKGEYNCCQRDRCGDDPPAKRYGNHHHLSFPPIADQMSFQTQAMMNPNTTQAPTHPRTVSITLPPRRPPSQDARRAVQMCGRTGR